MVYYKDLKNLENQEKKGIEYMAPSLSYLKIDNIIHYHLLAQKYNPTKYILTLTCCICAADII